MAGASMMLGLPVIWIDRELPLGIGEIQVNALVKQQWVVLAFPAVFSGIRFGGRADRLLFTRPLSSTQIALVQFRAALDHVLVSTGAVMAILFLWTLAPASEGAVRAPLLWLVLPHITLGNAGIFVFAVALFVAWLWKVRVQGLFVELAGRRWLTTTFYIATMAMFVCVVAAVPQFWWRPEAMQRATRFVPHVLAMLVALKAVAASKALRSLWRRRMINGEQLEVILTGWLLISATVFIVLAGAIPNDRLSLAAKILLAVHLVPLARLAAAPLAVEWNRHR
jgi:hypothetical protein